MQDLLSQVWNWLYYCRYSSFQIVITIQKYDLNESSKAIKVFNWCCHTATMSFTINVANNNPAFLATIYGEFCALYQCSNIYK